MRVSPESARPTLEAGEPELIEVRGRPLRIVVVAGNSAHARFKRENGDSVPESAEALAAWSETATDGPSTPFAELAGLVDVVRTRPLPPAGVQLLVVVNEPETDATVRMSVAALRMFCAKWQPVAFSVATVNIGVPYALAQDLAGVQRALPDRLAPIFFDPDLEVILNGTAGASAPKHVLSQLALLAKRDVMLSSHSGKASLVQAIPFRPDERATANLIDRVDAAVASVANGANPVEVLERSEVNGLAGLLAVEGSQLVRSRLADNLKRLLAHDGPRPYVAGAALLRSFASTTPGAEARQARHLADLLTSSTDSWVVQRLWSLNLVAEMVLHDDRHVQRVDRLAMQLAEPLLQSGVLRPVEVFWLSCAAWLHDWGHVGERLGSTPGEKRFISHPLDVRELHGELTRQLLVSRLATHGLTLSDAKAVGLLCAHHQGSTCCGFGVPFDEDSKPGARVPTGMTRAAQRYGYELPELDTDARDAGWPTDRHSALRLLVMILRIADAADVGRHRVPNFANRTEHIRGCATQVLGHEQALFEAYRSFRSGNELIVDELGRAFSDLFERPDLPAHLGKLQTVVATIPSNDPLLAVARRALDYVAFTQKQAGHYDKHDLVAGVRFVWRDHEFMAVVMPSETKSTTASLEVVDGDIRRELHGRPVGLNLDRGYIAKFLLDEFKIAYGGAEADS
jgi:hypothetical protein